MSEFANLIRPYVDAELEAASRAESAGDAAFAFRCLERAHVLGQASTVEHVRVHWRMLLWGWRRRSVRECAGQVTRIVGAATKTFIGFVPEGNTGGANVSPFRPMTVPRDLAEIIARVSRGERLQS